MVNGWFYWIEYGEGTTIGQWDESGCRFWVIGSEIQVDMDKTVVIIGAVCSMTHTAENGLLDMKKQ